MEHSLHKAESFNKIEFWAFTSLFVFVMFFFITDGIEDVGNLMAPNELFFKEQGVPFNFYENYFVPQLIRYLLLFVSFLWLNFVAIPQLIRKKALARNILLIIGLFVVAGIVLGITDTYLKNYSFVNYATEQEAYDSIFQKNFLFCFWLLCMLALYSVIKYAGIYLLSNAVTLQERYRFIAPDAITAFVVWMIGIFLLILAAGDDEELTAIWAVVPISAILLYCFAFYSLIPSSIPKKRGFLVYMMKVMLIAAITYLPISIFLMLLTNNEDTGFGGSAFNLAFQVFITAPLSWMLFKRHLRGNEEIVVLKKELGRSAANLDFLRSQINPHFLFNALNTIYGTAIQEKADRTSEGIERLGDMMRFMLQENMQEKISLVREIDYLTNYISLQKLRTDTNPNITIQTAIEEHVHPVQIAPMLLIPFVENAFKHGISFRENSHIKVGLEVKSNTLYFDVYNSRHEKPESDPEKNKSGIGLQNVKQRLQLIYAGRHELIIRETGKEFFVHLTIQLT